VVFLAHHLLAVLAGVADRDLAAPDIDRRFLQRLESGTALHDVTAHQAEGRSLRVDGGPLVPRAVLEKKDEPGRDASAAGVLDQVSVGEGNALRSLQDDKPVSESFRVPHSDRFAARGRGCEQHNGGDECAADERAAGSCAASYRAHVGLQVSAKKMCRPPVRRSPSCARARKHVRATHRVEGSLLFDRRGKRYIDEAVIALRSSSGGVRR